jgi:putative ABC transport system ATP-binding protein
MSAQLVQVRNVSKRFARDGFEVVALDHVNLDIERGDFLALMGPSGSGKSTLLNLLAGIDRCTEGEVDVLGTDLARLSESQLAGWRNTHIGYIFQTFNLIPVLTAFENVELPLLLTKLPKATRRKNVETALELVGLSDRMDHRPKQLSGGQEQRVAIARAIVSDPDLILADEPTGNLDARSGDEILNILSTLNRELHKTIVMVTHDPQAARFATHERHLEKGVLLDGSASEAGSAEHSIGA